MQRLGDRTFWRRPGKRVGISAVTGGGQDDYFWCWSTSTEPINPPPKGQHRSWRRLLAKAGARQSMSRKANCHDNAVIESFFGHLKEEMFHHTRYLSAETFTTALDDYITWFNTSRGHTHCEGLSPVQYRTQTLAA